MSDNNFDSKQMALIACEALDEKMGNNTQGNEITVIGLEGVSTLADYFIIASGNNRNQVQTLVDNVQEKLYRAGYEAKNVEGYDTANWILLDYGDIVIHVFSKEDRLFYDLERIWRDGKSLSYSDFKKDEA